MSTAAEILAAYALLGIEEGASPAEIKAGYRRRAALLHPDRHQSRTDDAEHAMQQLNAAYQLLRESESQPQGGAQPTTQSGQTASTPSGEPNQSRGGQKQRRGGIWAGLAAIVVVLGIGANAVLSGGGVDRDGTRDQFISDMEELGNTADGDCIGKVLANYSDDDIEALSEGSENATTQALAQELIACTDLLGD
jgi:hypothetical protein